MRERADDAVDRADDKVLDDAEYLDIAEAAIYTNHAHEQQRLVWNLTASLGRIGRHHRVIPLVLLLIWFVCAVGTDYGLYRYIRV